MDRYSTDRSGAIAVRTVDRAAWLVDEIEAVIQPEPEALCIAIGGGRPFSIFAW
jgi:hypothetical protein